MTLVVEDENQCNSVNFEPYQVLVSTIPFLTLRSHLLCAPAHQVIWMETQYKALRGRHCLRWLCQNQNRCRTRQESPLLQNLFIDFFDPDQVLEDCDDLMSFSAIIEHSFIGDLTMWITCPDGTEVLIMDNGASGGVDPSGCNNPDLGGNDLGEPVLEMVEDA